MGLAWPAGGSAPSGLTDQFQTHHLGAALPISGSAEPAGPKAPGSLLSVFFEHCVPLSSPTPQSRKGLVTIAHSWFRNRVSLLKFQSPDLTEILEKVKKERRTLARAPRRAAP